MMWPSMTKIVLYRAIHENLRMQHWESFKFDDEGEEDEGGEEEGGVSGGGETLSQYGKRVVMQLIGYANENNVSLANAHGICFDEKNLADLIGETSIVDKLVFENRNDKKNSLQTYKDDKLTKDWLPQNTEFQLQIIDILMNGLKSGPPPVANFWNALNTLERFEVICMGLTGIVNKETHIQDPEKLRLKLNTAFGYYDHPLIEDFESREEEENYEENNATDFLKSHNLLPKLILAEHPDFVRNNGAATRRLFKKKEKILCCGAKTGTSARFEPFQRDQARDPPYGEDVLEHEQSLYFVHYGDFHPDFHPQDFVPLLGKELFTKGPLYVSMSPRWKWTTGERVFVLKMRQNVTCDLVKPPSYAELCILEIGEDSSSGKYFVQTAVLPSVRLSNCAWKVTNIITIASGLKWKEVGKTEPTSGTKLENEALSDALKGDGWELPSKCTFTQARFDKFGIERLLPKDYILVGDRYFQPDEVGKDIIFCSQLDV